MKMFGGVDFRRYGFYGLGNFGKVGEILFGDGVDGDVFWCGEFIVLYLVIDEICDLFFFVCFEFGDDGVNVGVGFREYFAKFFYAAFFLVEVY